MDAAVETWTCSHCGTVNKRNWRFCARCEAMADGSRRTDHLPRTPRDPDKRVLPGLVLLAGVAVLVVGAVVFRAQAWAALAALVP